MAITLSGPPRQTEDIHVRGIVPLIVPDPGDGGEIQARLGELVELSTAGAETRTLPDPTFRGQEFALNLVAAEALATVVITADSPVNQARNPRITLSAAGQHVLLVGLMVETDRSRFNPTTTEQVTEVFEWRVVANDGAVIDTP